MKTKRLRRVFVFLTVLILGAFPGCQPPGIEKVLRVQELAERAVQGIRTDQEGVLTASGTIEAEEVRLSSELGGRILQVRTEKGREVGAGEVLVVLDSTEVLDKLAEAQAVVAAAEAELRVTQAGPRPEQVASARAALALAEAQRDGAFDAWQDALKAVREPQGLDAQIIETQTEVRLAEQMAILAQAQLDRERLLQDQTRKGSTEREIADWKVQAAERALQGAQVDLHTAQTALGWQRSIRDRPLSLIAQANAAEGQYRAAEQGVAVAMAGLNDLLAGPTPEEVEVAERAVQVAEAQAEVLEVSSRKLTLTSPVDGVVLNQVLRAGELAPPAGTILTLSDLSEVKLVVYVPVSQVGWVRLGQEIRVAVDSFPDRSFAGRVFRIGDEPEFTPRNVATQESRLNTYYGVEIRVPNSEGLLKPGMPADATF